MIISITPQIRDEKIAIFRDGDVLTINSQELDFTPLIEGATLPAEATGCPYIVGDVTRTNGQLLLTVLLPIAWDAPPEACFPAPIIDPPDGRIALPGETA